MKPSFQEFVNFIRVKQDLDPKFLETVSKRLFPVNDSIFYPSDLVESGEYYLDEAISLFHELNEHKVAQVEFECPNCSHTGLVDSNYSVCEDCNYDYYAERGRSIYIRTFGSLKGFEKSSYGKTTFNIQKAKQLAKIWYEQKQLPYLLIDLVSSQNLQRDMGDSLYSEFLSYFRELFKYDVLSQVKNYFVLGEIGDAIKVIYQNPFDLLKTVDILGKILSDDTLFKSFHKPESVPYFPRYSACSNFLDLPRGSNGKEINPDEVVVSTLNGSIDINTAKLTELFRLDSGLSIKPEYYKDNYVGMFTFDPLLHRLGFGEINTHHKKTVKDERTSGSGTFGILFFDKDGVKPASNPKECLKP